MSHKDFINKLAYEHIIQQYLFIKLLEKDFSDEYIKTMYRINASAIIEKYNKLSEDERKELETTIRKQIEVGEIDLNKEAVNWHRESLHAKHISEVNQDNNKKGKGR